MVINGEIKLKMEKQKLTEKEKQNIPEQDLIRQEESEQIKKEKSFKTKFNHEIEQEGKQDKGVLNDYYGSY